MRYKPNLLLYGANKNFLSSFKLAVTMRSDVDHEILSRSVAKAMERYPYFCVSVEKEGNSIFLQSNPRPIPVFADDRRVVLGSEESNYHLLTFACEGKRIFLNASHYIADGMGIDPLLKTMLYLYVSELYGSEGLICERIAMPGDEVAEGEYAYPFPDLPFDIDGDYLQRSLKKSAYTTDFDDMDADGLYAYHLRIPQRAMMQKANPSDGSPVSFLSVMLYRALHELDENIDQPIVAHVQHQYRAALNTPASRHSLVNYIAVSLPARMKAGEVTLQNTVLRGQILLGSEKEADLSAVNRLLSAFPSSESASLAEKKQAMSKYIEDSTCNKTFGISYVGKMDWCGLDRYVEDIHAYIGEKHTRNMILVEVMTIGDDFTVNFMQSGKGDRYVSAFTDQLRRMEIPVSLVGEEPYFLCDTQIPD